MKHRTRKRIRQWLALLLCLCMLFPSTAAYAEGEEAPADTGSLCEHHPAHTADCGYAKAVDGQACTHQHDETCGYQEPIEEVPCTHVHDADCGYREAAAEIPCDKACTDEDGDGQIDHEEGCAYLPAAEEQPCSHSHGEDCGYRAAQEGSPCTHVHDEACGYEESFEGSPCIFVCEVCGGTAKTASVLRQNAAAKTAPTFSQSTGAEIGEAPSQSNMAEPASALPQDATEYSAASYDEFKMVMIAVDAQQNQTDFVITLTGDIANSSDRFVGIAGKHITLKSADGNLYGISLGQELEGDITLDNVSVKTSEHMPVYANGHLFETTVNFPTDQATGLIHTLYGGGSQGHDVTETNLVLSGGLFENVYGGGRDSQVNGDVHIRMDGNANAGNFYGGGHAENTGGGAVAGNVYIDVLNGTLRRFLGGGNNQYTKASEDRTPAQVAGTVYFTAGAKGAQSGPLLATSWDSGGGSENSTVGNVVMKLLDGSRTDTGNELNIAGGGWNDDILGTVEILVDGGQINTVLGAGLEDYRAAVLLDGHRTRILNQDQKENAIHIKVANVPQDGDFMVDYVDGLGMGYGSQETDLVRGNVEIEIENSTVYQVSIGGFATNGSSGYAELEGEGTIRIANSSVSQIYGHKKNYNDGASRCRSFSTEQDKARRDLSATLTR